MKTWSRVLGLALCLGVLAVLSVPTSSPAVDPGPPGGLNVNVVNTPLPVQGTVNVGNFPASTNVNVVNTPTVHVSGTVQTQAGIPSGAFSVADVLLPPTTRAVISGRDPAGTSYAITSFTVANETGTAQIALLVGEYGTTVDCGGFTGAVFQQRGPAVTVPANATVHLPFPQPFVVAAESGANSCLVFLTTGPGILQLTVVGFKF